MTRIGPYEILKELGRGGMGVVYLARRGHGSSDELVALKVYPKEGRRRGAKLEKQRKRFRREAEAMASLDHPNIVAVYDYGQDPSSDYFAMEMVDGVDLEHYIQGEEQPIDSVLELVATVADAIDYAHRQGLVHRDLKPQNILVAPGGTPKVTDFGLARVLDDARTKLTKTGQLLGTPFYMSPEQCRGEVGDSDGRTDVFALGVILYELLTQEQPFTGKNPLQLFNAINHESPTPPRQLRPEVPPDLERVCLKALEKNPARRYQRASDLADDLRRCLAGEAVPTDRRRGVLLLAGLLLLILPLGYLAWEKLRPIEGDDEPEMARNGTDPTEESEPIERDGSSSAPGPTAPGLERLKAGDLSGARLAFTEGLDATQKPEELAELRYLRGICRYYSSDTDGAIQDFTRAIEHDPSFRSAYYQRARAYSSQNAIEQARADYTEILERKESGPVYMLRAGTFRARGQLERARRDFEAAWRLGPAEEEDRRFDAVFRKKIEELTSRLLDHPADVSALAWRARFRLRSGARTEAAEDHERVVRLADDENGRYYALCDRAFARFMLDDRDGARADVERTFRLREKKALEFLEEGRKKAHARKYRASLADYEKALTMNADLAEAHAQRGSAYFMLDEYEKAIADFTRALALNPNDAMAWSSRGRAHYELKRPGYRKRALADYARALDVNPDLGVAHHNRARLFLFEDAVEKALRDYNLAIEKGPEVNLPEMLHGRSRAHLLLGQYDAAIADATRAFGLRRATRYLAIRALAHGLAGHEKAAVQDFGTFTDPLYRALWRAVVRGDRSALEPFADVRRWDRALIRVCLGRLSEDQLLATVDREEDPKRSIHRCMIHGYLGILAEKTDRKAALRHFRACVETKQRNQLTYLWASARLREWKN